MTTATITTTSTTPAVREGRVQIAREALVDAFRKPRFAQRAAYRAELFRLARHSVSDLTDAELDAGLRAMVAAGNVQARKVNGKTMYHYTYFWDRAEQEARRKAMPPAFRPNTYNNNTWFDPDGQKLVWVGRPLYSARDGALMTVVLYEEGEQEITAYAPTVREAYREACRQQRLARHTVPDLLRQVHGLQRNLAIAERKIAADIGLQLWLYEEMGRLRARNAELERENAELRREAAGESLADDLVAIIAALTAERDALRAENGQLRYDMGCMKAEIEQLGSELDALRAFQSRQEREQPPF